MARLITLSDMARNGGYDTSQNAQNGIYDPSGKTAYGSDGTKVGTVTSAMVDPNSGRIRYLIVDTGGWFFSKEVLVPVGLARVEDDGVYFDTLTKDQVKGMREYRVGEDLTEEDEAQNATVVSGRDQSYRTIATTSTNAMPGSVVDDRGTVSMGSAATGATSQRRFAYETEDQNDTLFRAPQRLQLLEERLNVSKVRERIGEVEVGKRVETHVEKVQVPLEREEIVIERHPVEGGRVVDGAVLGAGSETIRVELEAERAQVGKQAVVVEEIEIGKRTLTETQTVEETLGREVLEVDRGGQISTERSSLQTTDMGTVTGGTRMDTSTTGVRYDTNSGQIGTDAGRNDNLLERAGDKIESATDRAPNNAVGRAVEKAGDAIEGATDRLSGNRNNR